MRKIAFKDEDEEERLYDYLDNRFGEDVTDMIHNCIHNKSNERISRFFVKQFREQEKKRLSSFIDRIVAKLSGRKSK